MLGGPLGLSAARSYEVGERPEEVTIADFNKDGRPDLAVANQDSGNVSILLGRPGGSFEAIAVLSVGAGPMSVTPSDFNRDGKVDLAVANYNSNNISILLGNGNGDFRTATEYAVGSGPRTVARWRF